MSALKDMTGLRFGRLTVLDRGPKAEKTMWACQCDCGISKIYDGNGLRTGRYKSCGCLRVEQNRTSRLKHGQAGKTRAYGVWQSMLQRCARPKSQSFKNYGGRGIAVCDRWHSFENFFADMGEPPIGMSIERKKNDIGYEPGNCEWATRVRQSRNKRNTIFLTHRGKTQSLPDWADELGVPYGRLANRYKAGKSAEEILSMSVAKTHPPHSKNPTQIEALDRLHSKHFA